MVVAGDHAVEPVGIGLGADEDEQSGTVDLLGLAGLPVEQLQVLQIFAAAGRVTSVQVSTSMLGVASICWIR